MADPHAQLHLVDGDGSKPPPLFVSALEAAHLLGLSRTRIYELLDLGLLVGGREGKRRLVSLASVHEYAQLLIEQSSASVEA
jgi:excisionase family DNA binding protein